MKKPVVVLVLFVFSVLSLSTEGQDAGVDVDVYVLLLQAGQLCVDGDLFLYDRLITEGEERRGGEGRRGRREVRSEKRKRDARGENNTSLSLTSTTGNQVLLLPPTPRCLLCTSP